jgi:hypothetical protein
LAGNRPFLIPESSAYLNFVMMPIYSLIRERARQIVSRFPDPDFYLDHRRANDDSRRFFETDKVIKKLHNYVAQHLEDDYGHGLQHAIKVSVEAGALMNVEGRTAGLEGHDLESRLRIVQTAGLLHDIKRKKKDHAKLGAAHARKVLRGYPFSPEEIEDIYRAIHNHEAFKSNIDIDTPAGLLVADCLYDADKFRWGPDNFAHTLWDMISFYNPPLDQFMKRYPQGMEGIARIKSTFRSRTGKKYGPQFIELGLAIGEELYTVIKKEFC